MFKNSHKNVDVAESNVDKKARLEAELSALNNEDKAAEEAAAPETEAEKSAVETTRVTLTHSQLNMAMNDVKERLDAIEALLK